MAMHRFFVPVLPFMYLLFGLLDRRLYRAHRRGRRMPSDSGRSLAFVALATFFPSTAARAIVLCLAAAAARQLPRGADRAVARRAAVGHRPLLRRLPPRAEPRASRRRRSARSATTRTCRFYDIHGLVDTHIAHMPPPPDFARRRAGHGRSDLQYTFSLEPTYVMFSRDLTPEPIDLWRYVPADLRADRRARLRAHLGVADRRAERRERLLHVLRAAGLGAPRATRGS